MGSSRRYTISPQATGPASTLAQPYHRLMADQRKVGHAIRRRMGANPSHYGQALAGIWRPPGPQPGQVGTPTSLGAEVGQTGGRLKGVPDVYETGTDTVGRGAGPPLARDNAAFASGVAGGVQGEAHPPRGRLSQGESSRARLTVSPSMKMPQESPVPIQGGGYPVPSVPGRSASFASGQEDMYWG